MPRMFARAPKTVWLHVLSEMWKLILLTAAVLMTVVAFAMVVKPLADGKIGPADAVKFMVMAMPVALQYTLPFAACFGATLSLYRLSSDNELTACHAGGISHRAMLVPALVTGLALSFGLLVLSNYAIPRFLQKMQQLITQDVSRLLATTIERGEAVQVGDQYLYADAALRSGPDRENGAFQTVWLSGVLFVKMDDKGGIDSQGTARKAQVLFRRTGASRPGKSMTEVVIRPIGGRGIQKGARAEISSAVRRELVPDPTRDNPKFLTLEELWRLRAFPENMDWIDEQRHALALTMAQLAAVDSLRESLTRTGKAEFRRAGDGPPVILHAGNIRPLPKDREHRSFRVIPAGPGEPIVIEEQGEDRAARKHTANAAILRLPTAEEQTLSQASLALEMLDVSAELLNPDADFDPAEIKPGGPTGAISKWTLDQLVPVREAAPGMLVTPTWPLMELAKKRIAEHPREADQLQGENRPLTRLRERVDDLIREVISKEQERLAYSAACLVMVLTGAVMAMRLRDSLPLTVYMWAFFPALATVICISAGQQMTHGFGLPGLALLWGGVIALGVYTGVEFVKLARH